ncbi:MAG TPA: hypothetical protein DCR40_07635 [Prolixibacteraceae bacterium]|nr:hypothetical protein [Prolixibacteraceae bacterium]
MNKKQENEKKFPDWEDLPEGSRRYWFEIEGRLGWKAKYIKTVDQEETTLTFRQEIYNELGILVELHKKYPEDKGHKKIDEP